VEIGYFSFVCISFGGSMYFVLCSGGQAQLAGGDGWLWELGAVSWEWGLSPVVCL